MVIAVFLVGAAVGLLVVRRRRRATLAGLNHEKPVFSVEPPHRRVAARKHEAL